MTSLEAASRADSGWLFDLDPRAKLWLVLLGMILLFVIGDLAGLALIVLAAHGILLAGGVPARRLAALWRGLIPLIVFILILQPLVMPGDGPPLWRIGPMRITAEGLLGGVRYALRLSAAAFIFAMMLATTPMNLLVRALEKLGLPYTLSMTMGLALHYMTALIDLYHTISDAQQARGWDLSQRMLLRRARAAVPTLVAVIIASLRLSDALALGLAARGFGLNRPRTIYRDIHMTRRDWLALLLSGLLFLLTLLLVLI